MSKKEYEIPCSWQEYGTLYIEAESWDEAIEIAEHGESSLPDGDYVDGSFEVDHDIIEFQREEARQQIRREVDSRKRDIPSEMCQDLLNLIDKREKNND